MARLADIVTRPHRAQLDLERVADLRRLPHLSGIAVVREPGTGYVLLGGEHRFAALRGRGEREAEVYVLRNWHDFVAWMMHDAAGRDRYDQTPWSMVDAAYLAIKAVELLKPAREERPYDDIAEYTGTHEGATANVRWLIALLSDEGEPDGVRQYAGNELVLISRGQAGAHGIRERVKKVRAQLDAAAAPVMPAAKQRDILGDAVAKLTGITNGLDSIGELNPELTADELADWITQLGKVNTKLIRLRTKLKEKA